MKKLTTTLLILSLLMTFSIVGLSDDTASHNINVFVSDLHLLALNNTDSITLSLNSATAGELPGDITDTSKALEYLVISSDDYKITAELNIDTPDSYDLSVLTTGIGAQYDGDGTGSAGSGSSVTLGTTSSDLITGINSPVITGNSGADLKYKLSFSDVPAPDTGGTTYQVTYTLTSTN
ncbi:hypothetical protein KGY71_07480 [Candidatus Bipolaricaulota bacterium]|nr:hypothetical protein [Candidatus Bipolaricaulota bacterium]